jgi:hypothetical protein
MISHAPTLPGPKGQGVVEAACKVLWKVIVTNSVGVQLIRGCEAGSTIQAARVGVRTEKSQAFELARLELRLESVVVRITAKRVVRNHSPLRIGAP